MVHRCVSLLVCFSMVACTFGGKSHWIEMPELKRRVKVYIPTMNVGTPSAGAVPMALPMVVSFHPMSFDPDRWEPMQNFNGLADKEGFVVAYPHGGVGAETISAMVPGFPSSWFTAGYTWNAGSCCPGASRDRIDDVQFAKDLVAKLKGGAVKELSDGTIDVDPSRIYATGHSNGAFLTFRLACQAPDLFAAIAPASAVLANEARGSLQQPAWPSDPFDCPKPSKPVPMLITHGTWDPLVPWDGHLLLNFRSVENNLEAMKAFNGIPEHDRGVETYSNGRAKCTSYGNTDSNVTLCRVDRMGHIWPADVPVCRLSKLTAGLFCSTSIDATVEAWEFFKRYRLTTTVPTNMNTTTSKGPTVLISYSAMASLQPLTIFCIVVFLFTVQACDRS